MDNNNKKDNKKESSVGGIIAFVIAVLVFVGDGAGMIFGILLVAAVIGVIIYAANAAKKRREAENGSAHAAGGNVRTAARAGFSKVMTEAKKLSEYTDDEHDESDHVDINPHEYLTDDEKRLRQLKSMLKNGIIEKDEYNILVRKFNL